ncbi:MAG TPA: phosphotransferase family protein [Acidimicrobiia bacterium]|nr:phosphotransferase family protein [Acidimicrobiia bacterium]
MTGDPAADVARRLTALLGQPVAGLERLSGGASRETWAFTAGGRPLILRRDPPRRAKEVGSMALEAAAIAAAASAGLAVPAVVAVDDGTRLGAAALVMTRVAGETLARRILRDGDFAAARRALPGQIGRFLAGLHAIDPGAVPGLPEPDALGYLTEMYDGIDDVSPTFETALRWLTLHRPPPGRRAIVHGDCRLGNLIVDGAGLAAVIDWELVHVGDPLEDLAWPCVKAWRFGAVPEVAGVGTIDDLLAAYEAAGGGAVERPAFDWWLVEKTLQWGIMCQKQAAAHLTGADRSVELAAIGPRAAEVEWDLLELLAPGPRRRALDGGPPSDRPGRPGREAGAALQPFGRPSAAELLEAVQEYLLGPVTGATSGQVRFHAKVAANVLANVVRQLDRAGPAGERLRAGLEGLGAATPAELGAAIRAGAFDDRAGELYPFLWATVHDRLAVANPRHLAPEN